MLTGGKHLAAKATAALIARRDGSLSLTMTWKGGAGRRTPPYTVTAARAVWAPRAMRCDAVRCGRVPPAPTALMWRWRSLRAVTSYVDPALRPARRGAERERALACTSTPFAKR
jgi:hypothetical protein